MVVTWDQTANAMYLAMGAEAKPAHRTVELDSGTLVDLDRFSVVVGVEIINPRRPLPTSEILEMHVPDADRVELEGYLRALSGASVDLSTTGTSSSTLQGSDVTPSRAVGVGRRHQP